MIFDPILDALDIVRDYLDPLVDFIVDFAEEHRFKQKIFGLITIGAGILSGAIDVEPGVHDITFAVVLIPAGLWILFTKTDLFNSQ